MMSKTSHFTKTIFLCFFFLASQWMQAQQHGITLFFKDGTTLNGSGRLSSKGHVKMKPDGKRKIEKFSFADLDHAMIGGVPHYLIPVRKHRSVVATKVHEGKLFLYKTMVEIVSSNSWETKERTYRTKYYIKERDAEFFHYLGEISKRKESKFWDPLNALTKSCKTLVESANTGKWKSEDLEEMVAFYNNGCVE